MSFKDLEKTISEWAAIEEFARKRKQAAEAAKRAEKARKARPPLYRPDSRPSGIEVVLLVRSKPGTEVEDLIEALFFIATMSELQAESEAKKKAQAKGLIWRGTVSIVRV